MIYVEIKFHVIIQLTVDLFEIKIFHFPQTLLHVRCSMVLRSVSYFLERDQGHDHVQILCRIRCKSVVSPCLLIIELNFTASWVWPLGTRVFGRWSRHWELSKYFVGSGANPVHTHVMVKSLDNHNNNFLGLWLIGSQNIWHMALWHMIS